MHISSDNVQPSSQTNAAEKVMLKKENPPKKGTFKDRQSEENYWKVHFWEASLPPALPEAEWKGEVVHADKRYKLETE